MRIVFTESFKIHWNGYNARHKKGVSGSHNGPMFMAEGLAAMGHEILFVSMRDHMEPGFHKGVQYINYSQYPPTTDPKHSCCDVIITTNNIYDLKIIDKIPYYKRVVLVMHNEFFNDDENNRHDFRPLYDKIDDRYIMQFFCQNSKDNILRMQPNFVPCRSIILPNSLDLSELAPQPPLENKKNQFVFFPVVERGFGMCTDLLDHFPDFELVTNTYDDFCLSYIPHHPRIRFTANSSKMEVYRALADSKYFVYSLVNYENINPHYDKGSIHYDTFGYVVIEALLHGVVVVAPKMEVFVQLFGDAICYVEMDDVVEPHYFTEWRKNNETFGRPVLDRYVAIIRTLETNPEMRAEYVRRGKALALKFCNHNVAEALCMAVQPRADVDKKRAHFRALAEQCNVIPQPHVDHLWSLKKAGFEPKVIYDIGACVLHWTQVAKEIWPDAHIILFEANKEVEFLLQESGLQYHIGLLGKENGALKPYFYNDEQPGGNSYFREVGCEGGKYYPTERFRNCSTATLASIVQHRGFPMPDLVKMDVQGAERDIVLGAVDLLKNARHLILELQCVEYNLGAPRHLEVLKILDDLGWDCVAPLFCDNGADGDYDFVPRTA